MISFLQNLVKLSRLNKQLILFLIDSILIISVIMASFSMRLGFLYWPESNLKWLIFGAPLLAIPIFIVFGLYRAIVRFIGFKALWIIVQASTFYALLWGVIGFMVKAEGIPRSVILINWIMIMLVIGVSRMLMRWLLSEALSIKNFDDCINVVIYGAGSSGRQLSIALSQSSEYNPVAFIDDRTEMQNQSINGLDVITKDDLGSLINAKNVTEVLLAIPNINRSQRNKIIQFLEPYAVHVRSLPSVSELAQGKVKIADLREISIKDLLGRDSVAPNKKLLSKNITNKVVMVTGAGGSIGSELSRQILFLNPIVIILFEQSELALYNIDKELSLISKSDTKILPILGSVNNSRRLSHIMQSFNVQTIYHAAAYKHVPMVEFNNSEGVSNNIFGTINCAEMAIENGVETFVLISTDKAVHPTNTMGATKRFAELVLQAMDHKNKINTSVDAESKVDAKPNTIFSIVRFGNVLGSSGSVIPLFKEQIKDGGPITVTDVKILRYFMSVNEAVELVIQAGAMAKGGDVFVLNMGEPVRIIDLAKKMIRLSGLEVKDKDNPNGDIEIKFTGLRPGEKLYEELIMGENISETDNPMIMRAVEEMLDWNDLNGIIKDLKTAIHNKDHKRIRELLTHAVPTFKPQNKITDFLHQPEV